MYAYINMWVCVSSPQQSQLSQSSHTSYYSLAGAKEWGHASMPRKPLLFKRILYTVRQPAGHHSEAFCFKQPGKMIKHVHQ